MATNARLELDRSDTTDESLTTVADEIPDGATRLGIDAAGRLHYWHLAGRTVYVVTLVDVDTATIDAYDVRPGTEVRKWVGHCADICGWESIQHDDEWLTNTLTEAV